MDQSHLHRFVLIPLAAVLVAALSAVHADATIASRTTVKRKTPKLTAPTTPTVTTKPTVTSTVAAPAPTSAATASKASACDLVTAAEAAVVVNASNLVADAGSSHWSCAYRRNGVGSPVTLISLTGFDNNALFALSRSSAGASSRAVPLPGLADAAYRSPDWSQIEFLKGKIAALIIMNVIDANGTFSGPDETKALDAARVAASRA